MSILTTIVFADLVKRVQNEKNWKIYYWKTDNRSYNLNADSFSVHHMAVQTNFVFADLFIKPERSTKKKTEKYISRKPIIVATIWIKIYV